MLHAQLWLQPRTRPKCGLSRGGNHKAVRLLTVSVLLLAVACGPEKSVPDEWATAEGEARGGKGGGKPTPAPTVALTVSRNPVPAGAWATVAGTGFTPGVTVNFVVSGGSVIGTGANADGVAHISFVVDSPGTVGVTVKQRASDGSFVVVGFFTFNVV